jgi:AcrR family transcriptional regulator
MQDITEANVPPGAARGDATRESLIASAIEIFGRDGFGAASTRAIAQAAGVNQALIGYHFGGKPGLYMAALRHIAESVSARLEPLLGTIETELSAGSAAANPQREAKQALELLHDLIGAFVQMLTSDESAPWARMILREQQQPSEGFDILYDGIMRRMLTVTSQLVRRARQGKTGEQQAKLTAVTILGQALVFRVARTAVMRQMGWEKLEPAEVETIKAMLRCNVAAMLNTE